MNEPFSSLADMLNAAIHDPKVAEQHLAVYRNELDRLAAKEVGNGKQTAKEISELEAEHPQAMLPQLFWATRSLMHVQIMSLAASRTAHWK